MPKEPRQLDLFKLTAPPAVRANSNRTWWTVDARAPEPSPNVESQMERALAILTQLTGMKLLVVRGCARGGY